MKTLLIMRHAKSSWADSSLSDFERPLNERGQRDAPRMGQWLIEHELVPQLIISSPANRAKTTAEIVAQNADYGGDIQFREQLYHGTPRDYVSVLKLVSATNEVVMVVGHNPGLENLVERLTGDFERMPTSAIAQIKCQLTDWNTIAANGSNELVDVWRPKEIFR
jgi:phosphohistidine phosphatase